MNLKGILSVTEVSRENIRVGILWGLFVALLGANMLVYPRALLGNFLAQKSYDLPFLVRDYIFKKRYSITNVVLAFMDEDSHTQLRQDYNTAWDRNIHAAFLRRMKAEGAKAVVFDIVFTDLTDADTNFAASMREMKNVIVAADNAPFRQTGAGHHYEIPKSDVILEGLTGKSMDSLIDDLSPLKDHIGVDEVDSDTDLEVRRHRSFSFINDEFYPMSWVAAKMAKANVTMEPEAWRNEFWVNYYGPPRDAIPHFSYWRVFDTNRFFSEGYFKDKVVFVGADLLTGFSGQRKDAYKSPYPRRFRRTDEVSGAGGHYENAEPIPGVEVQATMFLNLLRGDWITKLADARQFNLVLAIGFFSSFALMLLRPARALTFAVLFVLVISGLGIFSAAVQHVWFSWMIPVVQIGFGTLGSVAYNGIRLQLHRAVLQNSVSMYVSPAVATAVLSKPDMMRPGAKKETISIMFTDIADFTKMSEGMDSDALAQLMNTYFELGVNQCIHPTQGTVVKFIGDAIFSIWNAPLPQPNHRELACRAAILLRDQVTDFEFSKPGQQVLTRIGLHTGMASVGNFGSTNRVDYTAFGENVNLSSRMEGLNKYLGTRILATGDIIEPVQNQFTTRYLGPFQLKGFARAFKVYELIGGPERMESTAALRTEFAAGLEAFVRRDFDAAELKFKQVMQMNPKDGPSKYYLGLINDFRVNPPSESWKGEIELKEK